MRWVAVETVVAKTVVAEEDAANEHSLIISDRDGRTLKPILKLLLSHWDESPLGFRQVRGRQIQPAQTPEICTAVKPSLSEIFYD